MTKIHHSFSKATQKWVAFFVYYQEFVKNFVLALRAKDENCRIIYVMKIEIEELESLKSNNDFVDYELQSGLQGGKICITLNNGNCYEFIMQKFVDKMIHRTYGKGFIKNIKKYEENN